MEYTLVNPMLNSDVPTIRVIVVLLFAFHNPRACISTRHRFSSDDHVRIGPSIADKQQQQQQRQMAPEKKDVPQPGRVEIPATAYFISTE